jgi:hypothetical protein
MAKYNTLLKILDQIRFETKERHLKKYAIGESDEEKINQARARAFIHLYLKVGFGIEDFEKRENYVTDGSYDGGIDGYYIDNESRTIYFIQSKFRQSQVNFENKKITLEEILVMDINRILEGEEKDEQGNEYNGKIKQLQREISEVEGISRYSYLVIILANLDDNIPQSKLRYLTGGYAVEVINHKTCYEKQIFPVITGTHFNASDINIYLDLSNKNAGSKISYRVQTSNGECEITVLFIPTIEIAKVMSIYKNSILRYNPRSYLELDGKKVNTAIRETILEQSTNEFALFNNGITMLSDETFLNEKIGQKNKAQLTVKNPQIINGGQTAYTLSKIYEEQPVEDSETIFQSKEVLLKIITLLDNEEVQEDNETKKLNLIEDISTATNQQTPVISSDKFANDALHIELQKKLFNDYGLLYERKRGEFNDGITQNYIDPKEVIERNLFFRLLYAAQGKINMATKRKLFQDHDFTEDFILSDSTLRMSFYAHLCLKKMLPKNKFLSRKDRSYFGKIYVFTKLYMPKELEDFEKSIDDNKSEFESIWDEFESHIANDTNRNYVTYIDNKTGEAKKVFRSIRWHRNSVFEKDVIDYFNKSITNNI